MGRSVSYPSAASVVTFATLEDPDCYSCDGSGKDESEPDGKCMTCAGEGKLNATDCDFDELIDDFRSHLKELFPSVVSADDWIDREDHVLAENSLAYFGMSEYCGLVAYWIVPKNDYGGLGRGRYDATDTDLSDLATHWAKSVANKFVAAFGELTKVGAMSNGEGVYRRIDK